MENKKIYSEAWISYLAMVAVFIAVSCFFFAEMHFVGGVIFAAIGIGCVVALFFKPYCYSFDRNGISICYLFGRSHSFAYESIDLVICQTKNGSNGNAVHEYEISGTPEKAPASYMKSIVQKTKSTEKAMNYYMEEKTVDFTVPAKRKKGDGEDWERFGSCLEDDMRANIDRYAEFHSSKLSPLGLELSHRYVYVKDEDEDYVEYEQKPEEACAYTVVFDVFETGETDPDRILPFEISLVEYDDSKKKRVSVSDVAVMLMINCLDDMLEEIRNVGIDGYLNDTEEDE